MKRWLGRRRVRFIPQLEVAECGAAALAMVLDYHGCSLPLVEVRTACAVTRDGASAGRIVKAARAFGLEARGLKLELADLAQLPLPAILHWELNHFVVLERRTRRGATLVDPARGRRHVSERALGEAFTGVALAFAPSERLPRRARRSHSLKRYLAVLARERRALGYVALCMVLLQLLGVLSAASTELVVDQVIKPQRAAWLLPIGLTLGMALLIRHSLELLRSRALIGLQTALDLTLSSAFMEHLMRLPLGFFEQRSAGDLMQRVEHNGQLRAITAALMLSVLDGVMLCTYGALLLAYDLRLGGLTLALGLSRAVLVQRARRALREGSERMLALAGREHGAVVEALAAPEMMRALGAESLLFARYSGRMSERLNVELGVKRARGGLLAMMLVFDGAATALVLWLGGSEVIAGRMTVGVFAGFLVMQRLVDAPLSALFGCVEQYLYAQAILARIDDVFDAAPEPTGTRSLPGLRGEIAFDRVSFRFAPSAPWLFQELSFRVGAGEKVAIVGRSGQGKSTLMKLLLGVLQPEQGQILIDGVPLAELDRQALAQQIGVVTQEPFVLADSVEANLRLRFPHASRAALERAARIACVHEVITALPHGYRTRLGAQGLELSGGQRQRLAVARAVVGGPRLLLLDEATSSLDLESEAALHQNLGALGCTRLLIAHRLATVRDADRILVIEQGAIAQAGRFDELARAAGPFRALLEAGTP